jgi:hypothetical protein
MRSPEELAWEWYWDNLSDKPYAAMLTNPPKYAGNPVHAFLAGYQAAKKSNSPINSDSLNHSDSPDLQEQLEALNQYMSIAQNRILWLEREVSYLIKQQQKASDDAAKMLAPSSTAIEE